MSRIHVGASTILRDGRGRVRWQVPIDAPGLPQALWFSVPEKYAEMLSERADAALLVLMLPAMRRGAELTLEGRVSSDLAWWQRDAQHIYGETGHGRPVRVDFASLEPPSSAPGAVATGFSGGVDSFAVLAEHHHHMVGGSSQQLTHLLYSNVGSHASSDQRTLWGRRLRNLKPKAEELGLPLVDVDSNVDSFYQEGPNFEASHTPRNAAVAHALGSGIGTWLYASAFSYGQMGVYPHAKSTGYTDATVLPLLSTAGLMLRSSGGQYSRVDKTAIVAAMRDAWDVLDVCAESQIGVNCSRCWKCLRTMATLDLLGELDRFSARFDLALRAEQRDRYFANLMVGPLSPLDLEVRTLMGQRHFRPGMGVRARVLKYRMQAMRGRST